jgi:hypothetical protein
MLITSPVKQISHAAPDLPQKNLPVAARNLF